MYFEILFSDSHLLGTTQFLSINQLSNMNTMSTAINSAVTSDSPNLHRNF